MTKFAKRNTQPLRPDSYRRLARLIRGYADRIEALAEPQTPREKASLTTALGGINRLIYTHWLRHRGTTPGEVFARDQADREREIDAALKHAQSPHGAPR